MINNKRERRATRNEQYFDAALAAFKRKHGLAKTVATGGATLEEIEKAREMYGYLETHEEWLAATGVGDKG